MQTTSSGYGVEKEALDLLWRQVIDDQARFLLQRDNGLATIATSCNMVTSGRGVSSSRLLELQYLGALVALMLINYMPPRPLDPVVLQYFIYGCSFDSITKPLLAEWHPELRDTLDRWLEVGPAGNINKDRFITPISTYLDRQVRTFTPLKNALPCSYESPGCHPSNQGLCISQCNRI